MRYSDVDKVTCCSLRDDIFRLFPCCYQIVSKQELGYLDRELRFKFRFARNPDSDISGR